MKIKRLSPGAYTVHHKGSTVWITRNTELPSRYGQWIAYADWDRYLCTDPIMTYAEAKEEAIQMLNERTES